MLRLLGLLRLLRIELSANWWLLRFDLRTARRLLGFALLAARRRLTIMDERRVRSAGGYEYLQLELSPLPPGPAPGDAGAAPPAPGIAVYYTQTPPYWFLPSPPPTRRR